MRNPILGLEARFSTGLVVVLRLTADGVRIATMFPTERGSFGMAEWLRAIEKKLLCKVESALAGWALHTNDEIPIPNGQPQWN